MQFVRPYKVFRNLPDISVFIRRYEFRTDRGVTVLCPWDIKQMSKTIICTRIAAVCCSLFRAELRHKSVHLRFAGLVPCAAQRYLRFTQSEFLHLFQLGAHQPRGSRGP